MKKTALFFAALAAIVSLTACGSPNPDSGASTPESSQEDTSSTASRGESTFTGILNDNKDFMTIVNSKDNQNSYIFELKGITCDAEVGDKVTVIYTGNIEDPDTDLTATKVEKVE